MKKLLLIFAAAVLGVACSSDSEDLNIVSYSVRIYHYTIVGSTASYGGELGLMDTVVNMITRANVHFGQKEIIADKFEDADKQIRTFIRQQLDNFPKDEFIQRFSNEERFELEFIYGATRYDEKLKKVVMPLKLKYTPKDGFVEIDDPNDLGYANQGGTPTE